ncbi:regulatory protein RecX [Phosphitispora fastidiosa]|uniref:regulatory protein RecX n=1 Tax=Phosphitispora fastidiosa TaxID=2837202 RepID=UPI001E5AC928|nr:regulatory protein RecX [Phosphitispora fastidiosa]
MPADREKKAHAKDDALNYISYRPRSAWEVRKKLFEKGYESEIVSEVIGFLEEYRFIDDLEFSRMWLRSRTRDKPSGRRKISHELFQKGISRDIIEECLAGYSPEQEEEIACLLAEKKISQKGFELKKIEGFLLRRGFDYNIVRKVLSKILEKIG